MTRIALVSLAVTASTAHAAADCDSSDRSAGRLVVDLGHLAIHDDGNNADYSWAICETYNVYEQKGKVDIVGGGVTGTVLELADAEKLAQQADQECMNRGAPYSASSPTDQRMIEYHFCQKGGVPNRLEVVMRPLDRKGAAKPVQTLKVPFPDLRAMPAKHTAFVEASLSDKQVDCESGERALGKIDARDDANLTVYRFIVCQAANKDVNVRSNFLTGTVWRSQAVASQAEAGDCITGGAPYGKQGPGDDRAITYRLCPHAVEVEAVMLDANWKKRPPKKLSAPLK
jgi:hypothetical protein